MGMFDFVGDAIGGVGDWVGDTFLGGNAAKAARDAAGVQSEYQNRALDYQMEQDALPTQFRESAMRRLAGMAGMEGGEGDMQGMVDRARNNPLYDAIMSTQEAGNRSRADMASVTGMRGGNLSGELSDYAMQLENKALMDSINQEQNILSGFSGTPSNANNIANTMSNIGTTQAAGITGAAQAREQGLNNMIGLGSNIIMGI